MWTRTLGGMKRRLVIARALLSHPTVLVLDEPTTGLDPAGRHLVWSRVLELRRQGATILLSTHNMEEAMALCDRLVIIDGGRVLAQGKPQDLVLEHAGHEVVEVRPQFGEMESVKGLLTSRGLRVEEAAPALLVLSRNGDTLERDLAVEGLHVVHRTANLEDVFLRLTAGGWKRVKCDRTGRRVQLRGLVTTSRRLLQELDDRDGRHGGGAHPPSGGNRLRAGQFVGEVDGGVGYAEFVAPGFIASYAMFHSLLEAGYGAFLRMSMHRIYDNVLATPVGVSDLVVGSACGAPPARR